MNNNNNIWGPPAWISFLFLLLIIQYNPSEIRFKNYYFTYIIYNKNFINS